MSKVTKRDNYFVNSGKKWGEAIVDRILDKKTDGFYTDVDFVLNKVEKTCFDYAVGNKKTKKGKALSSDDINFYQGAFLSINQKRNKISSFNADRRFTKKWKYRFQ